MMERYDSYKPSGVAWIGEIPSHWESSQLRKFLSLVSEKGHGEKQLLSVTRENGVIVRDVESKESNHNYIPDDLNGYKLVKVGQFAINKMKSWQGSYGVSKYDGIVSPAYYVCDLNFGNKDFFSWAIRSKAYVPFFTQMSKGIRVDQWDLSTDALKSIPFFVPSVNEQKKIVEFLLTKTSLINAQQSERERERVTAA
jgi:type I restriction enzyme S subunit